MRFSTGLWAVFFVMGICLPTAAGAACASQAAKASQAFAQGRFNLAIELVNTCLQDKDANQAELFSARLLRGISRLKLKQYGPALEDFNQVIKNNPGMAMLHQLRSRAWLEQGDDRAALEDASKALEIETHAAGYRVRGKVYEQIGDFEMAVDDFLSAARLNPGYALVLADLAWLKATCPKAEIRDGAQAVSYAKKALSLKQSAWFKVVMAAAYAESGDFALAVSTQKQAIREIKGQPAEQKALPVYAAMLARYEKGAPYRQSRR